MSTNTLQTIARDKIKVDQVFNARETLKDIPQLAKTIKTDGLLQPVIVRPQKGKDGKPDGTFFLVAGFRRMAALDTLSWKEIPCTVVNITDEKDAYLQNLSENVARESLSGYELGKAVKHIKDTYGMSGSQISARVSGTSKGYINNLLAISENVMSEILEQWHAGHPCATTDFLRTLAKTDKDGNPMAENEQYAAWVRQCKGKGKDFGFGDGEDPTGDYAPNSEKGSEEAGGSAGRAGGSDKPKRPSVAVMVLLQEAIEASKADEELENTDAGSLACSVIKFSLGLVSKVQVTGFYFEPENAKANAKEEEEKANSGAKGKK